MRLVTYRRTLEAPARLGFMHGEWVVDVERCGAAHNIKLPSTMLDFIELGAPALSILIELAAHERLRLLAGSIFPIEDVRLLAPIPRPRKNIFGVGLNYVEHVVESSRTLDTSKDLPKKPVLFSKPPTTVVGPGDPVEHNGELTQQLDWEVELAVIIGRTAKRASVPRALEYVFGYSVMIDVSARDNRRAGQWIYSKGMDTYAPFGPCIVTADEIPDPHDLNLWLTVNNVEKQRSNTRHMYFKIPTLVADISAGITLESGDIIATGTPEGVGAGRTPQEWLWPGDIVEAGIDGIGRIRNPIVRA